MESTSVSESYQEKHCRSDSTLGNSDGNSIPCKRARSEPNMDQIQDSQEFAVPSIPASSRSCSDSQCGQLFKAASSTGSASPLSKKNRVEDALYRNRNLATNNIHMRRRHTPLPKLVSSLVDFVSKDRDSPGPSVEDLEQDQSLDELESVVEEMSVQLYFQYAIARGFQHSLRQSSRFPMVKSVIPDTGSSFKVSKPVPDLLYGYKHDRAFPRQQTQLLAMGDEMRANSLGLIYPFFLIEFKGDCAANTGSLWVATNQCLGGSASCVNIAERLNDRLRRCTQGEVSLIDSSVFSIAMNGTEARLYISWKQDELYYMQSVKSFLLQKPTDHLEFRKYVRNIFDWGENRRLNEIQNALDNLGENRCD